MAENLSIYQKKYVFNFHSLIRCFIFFLYLMDFYISVLITPLINAKDLNT